MLNQKSINQKPKNPSPFGSVINEYFSTEEGQKLLDYITLKYGYPDSGDYYLQYDRDSEKLFEDISAGGDIYKFAPDFENDNISFEGLIDYIHLNMQAIIDDKSFNISLYNTKGPKYIISHFFVCNRIREAFCKQLISKFNKDVIYYAPNSHRKNDPVIIVKYKLKKYEIKLGRWNKISKEDKLTLFSTTFIDNVNVFPNSALIDELNMLSNTTLQLVERRHLTTIYRIGASGRVYQIKKDNPEKEYWIYNDINEYLSTEHKDDIEEYFALSNLYITFYSKGYDTFITDRNCTAQIVESSNHEFSVTDFKFTPNVSEELKEETIKKFGYIVKRQNKYLPLARYQTPESKRRFARHLNHFNSQPRNLYL